VSVDKKQGSGIGGQPYPATRHDMQREGSVPIKGGTPSPRRQSYRVRSHWYLFESRFLAKISQGAQRKLLEDKELCLAQRRQERKDQGGASLSSWRSLRLGERRASVAAGGRAGLAMT